MIVFYTREIIEFKTCPLACPVYAPSAQKLNLVLGLTMEYLTPFSLLDGIPFSLPRSSGIRLSLMFTKISFSWRHRFEYKRCHNHTEGNMNTVDDWILNIEVRRLFTMDWVEKKVAEAEQPRHFL